LLGQSGSGALSAPRRHDNGQDVVVQEVLPTASRRVPPYEP
jgi:hypothetical protein